MVRAGQAPGAAGLSRQCPPSCGRRRRPQMGPPAVPPAATSAAGRRTPHRRRTVLRAARVSASRRRRGCSTLDTRAGCCRPATSGRFRPQRPPQPVGSARPLREVERVPYFKDSDEVYATLGKLFQDLASDPELSEKFRKANTIVQYAYREPDSTITVRLRRATRRRRLRRDRDGAEVTMSMEADTAHRFWLGKVNVTVALARGRSRRRAGCEDPQARAGTSRSSPLQGPARGAGPGRPRQRRLSVTHAFPDYYQFAHPTRVVAAAA